MTDAAYESDSWSLDDIIPAESGSERERAFAEIEAAAAALESKRPALVPEIEEQTFGEILGLVEKSATVTSLLDGYAILRLFADMTDQDAVAFRGRVEKTLADTSNRTLFFDLWWKALDDANARRLLAVAGDNAYYLETLRSFAPYTFSETEERVINLKNVNGAAGMVTL
ncbi:oligoendopeptidase F, partial [Candidatus Bipolaricaulota bacterium]